MAKIKALPMAATSCCTATEAMRDLGITSKMGCKCLWCPRYTTTLPPYIYRRAGWETTDLWGWQYAGMGQRILKAIPRLPRSVKRDITVLTFLEDWKACSP